MELNKSIVLLGMMGSGKSTIGYLLSKKLDLKFKDVDKIIEKKANNKISDIFLSKGEEYFRKLEEKITIKTLKNNQSVIALGGGAFINNEIRKKVLSSCVSVWLKVDLDKLVKRYSKNDRRPMLNKKRLRPEIKKIYQSRKKIYELADFKINCDNIDKTKIVQKIIDFYEN